QLRGRGEVPHDSAAFVAGQIVDVELAAQVVGLVLQAAGEFAGAGHDDLFLAEVNPFHHRVVRTSPGGGDAGEGQAGLRSLDAVAQFHDPRVDHVAPLAVYVVAEDRQAGADLVGGEPGPARFGHGVQKVGDQARQGIVEAHHRLARRTQHRVAE